MLLSLWWGKIHSLCMYFFTGSGKMKDDLRGPYFSRKAGWK
jgi:hypothetical protein